MDEDYFRAVVQAGDEYGMWIYGATHNLWDAKEDRPRLYRVWQLSHYQQVSHARFTLKEGVNAADFEEFMRSNVLKHLGIVFQFDKTISHGFTKADWLASEHFLLHSNQADKAREYLWISRQTGSGHGSLEDQELMAERQILEGYGRSPEEQDTEERPQPDHEYHRSTPASGMASEPRPYRIGEARGEVSSGDTSKWSS
jgi:hypothetical protein